MSYMGVDVGTTGCKAVIFDERGKQIASAYREYPVLSPQEGFAELDSRHVGDCCLESIAEATAVCPGDPVCAIGVSSQGEAFTAIGADGAVMGNGMVSSDARASRIAVEWSEEFGRERLYQITGHTAHPMFSVFKLLWVRDNQPDVWSGAAKFLCYEDFLHHRLGVEPAISWPLAGRTILFDIRRHIWSQEILESIGLEEEHLSRVLPSGEIVGKVAAPAAFALGLADDVIVVTGGHDQPCGALGAGVMQSGRSMYATGTVECLCPMFAEPVLSDSLMGSNLCTYDYTVRGKYTTVAFNLTGGNLLKWFRDEWGRGEVDEARRTGSDPYALVLDQMPEEPTRLMALPYFTPSGTPYFDPDVSGAILGLRLTTTRGEVLKALLEGLSFEMRLNLDIMARSGIAIDQLLAIGGGAKNRKWLQLKSDVMNKPITTVAVTEAACFGAAMLACAAHQREDVTAIASGWVREVDCIEPNPARAAYYDERFEKYVELYPKLKRIEV